MSLPAGALSHAVLAGAWGAEAGALLERVSGRRGESTHRVGELTMLGPPQASTEAWCCWLFGAPEDRGPLTVRFGLSADGDLPSALVRALGALGARACATLCGRFVAVLLDRRRERCLVVRDQLGAQRLIHARTAGGVVFAEHERDLLEALPATPDPDRLALAQWIESGLTLPGRTLYEGVRRLPAGHRLELEGPSARVERWWTPRYVDVHAGRGEDLEELLREAAFAAIARAAAGCRRPAVKLSGGLDSACVAAGLATGGFADGRGLAVAGAFPAEPSADESELIEATARHSHLPLALVPFAPGGSIAAPALAHIARWRLPPGSPTLFLWEPVLRRARSLGADRLLDGEGGDELFGLATYLIADRLRAGRALAAWSLAGRVPGMARDGSPRTRLRVLRRYGLGPLVPSALRRRREARARRLASPGAIVPPADAQALSQLWATAENGRREGPLWWRRQVEAVIDMRDRLDMAGHFGRESSDHGLDVRHPFLHDLRLIEAVLRLPPQAQFDPARDRPLLRDALRDLIPEAVRTRHAKSHFSALVLAGIRADEGQLIQPLRRPDAPVRAHIRAAALDGLLATPPGARPVLGAGILWRLAIANRWLLSQAQPHPRAEPTSAHELAAPKATKRRPPNGPRS